MIFSGRATFSELRKAVREGRESGGSYAANPYGPPPNFTNAGWSHRQQALNAAFIRGINWLKAREES